VTAQVRNATAPRRQVYANVYETATTPQRQVNATSEHDNADSSYWAFERSARGDFSDAGAMNIEGEKIESTA